MPAAEKKLPDYSVSRRRLGICYVGTIVLFSIVALSSNLAVHIFGSEDVSTARWFANILLCVWTFEVVCLPFDIVGFNIERAHQKTVQTLPEYLFVWSQSAFKHGTLLLSAIFAFTCAGRSLGVSGVFVSTLLLTIFFIWKQAEIARFISNVSFEEPNSAVRASFGANKNKTADLVIARCTDSGFTGGIVGLPRKESLVLPLSWVVDFSQEELWAEVTRRRSALESGSRSRGVIGAILFVTVSVTASAAVTFFIYRLPLGSTAGIVTTSLISTLWSFLGLLFMPYFSQRGVFETDKLAIAKGVGLKLFSETIKKIDERMENEVSRSDSVQFVFHPIPTIDRRLGALNVPTAQGAWNINRYSVWLSIVGLGLLGRAVHCNAGRPELWCMLPAD